MLWFLFLWQSAFHVTERALKHILCFLKYFVKVFGLAYQNGHLVKIGDQIPVSLQQAEKLLGIHNREIINYTVCPKCHSIFKFEECVVRTCFGKLESKLCNYIKYPDHPHPSRRQPCNTTLLKTLNINRLRAFKSFAYCPLKVSFQRLVLQPGFLCLCEAWREREHTIPENILGDIYDGSVWKSFRYDFLSSPYSYLLILNVDWFQPYKRTEYSVGAIYATIQNLPREKRYREEYIVLIGIIPGPKEPSLTINSYLQPLIDELQSAYLNGFVVSTSQGTNITIRLAVSCISCDIPATRKLCGFLSHNATLGCNKCYKEFGKCDVTESEFSRSWDIRTAEQHISHCEEILLEVTKSGIEEMESKYGVRYCSLLQLSYYDPIKFVAVDMMHNLFLGTGKHTFTTWIELHLISKEDLEAIDTMVNRFVVPSCIGRLPVGFKSNYMGFKASQWSSWILIYSPVILKHLLPQEHYSCWLLFVRACNILSQRILRLSDVDTADSLLELFCKKFECLYGRVYCTPNMHLHLHLKQTILDFGPAHATWCYSFERYNGIIGSISTNKHSVELQFMQKFLRTQMIQSLATKVNDTELLELAPKENQTNIKTLSRCVNTDSELLTLLELSHGNLDPHVHSYKDNGYTELLLPHKELVFDNTEMRHLQCLYQQLSPCYTIEYVSPFYTHSGRVSIGGDILGSIVNNRTAKSSSVVAAYWPTSGNNITNINYSCRSIGKVIYYFKQSVTLRKTNAKSSMTVYYTMAHVHWMKPHSESSIYGISATVCANEFEEISLCCYIPILRILGKCAHCLMTSHDETIFVACPIPIKLSI